MTPAQSWCVGSGLEDRDSARGAPDHVRMAGIRAVVQAVIRGAIIGQEAHAGGERVQGVHHDRDGWDRRGFVDLGGEW